LEFPVELLNKKSFKTEREKKVKKNTLPYQDANSMSSHLVQNEKERRRKKLFLAGKKSRSPNETLLA
jgi:hypothetical protein